MKKLLAIILALTFILSLAACGKNDKPEPIADISDVTVLDVTSTESKTSDTENEETFDTTSSEKTFEDVKSFDDFVDKMDENGFKTTQTETKDGIIIVDMEVPATNTDKDKNTVTTKPAIPTIETVVKPQTPTKPEKEESKTEEAVTPEKETAPEETVTPAEPEKTTEPQTPDEPEKPVETIKPKPQTPQYTYTTNQKHTKVPYTERYLYSVLDEEKKGWYRAIDKAVNNLENRAYIGAEMAENRGYYIYYLYMFDNPEHFYLGNSVGIYTNGGSDDGLIITYSVSRTKGEYCGSGYGYMTEELKNKIIAKKATFEKEVNRILSTIPADAPDVWKEKLIYDRILTDSHYNLSAQWDGLAEDNWTAYGIMINKMGVCESYSEAFQTLCLYAGINCTGVVGIAGGGHKWNCVQLDGEWYMCDVTFDDPIGGESGAAYHYYFNLTSDKMKEYQHNWENSQWPVPNCTATKYSYTNYFGN